MVDNAEQSLKIALRKKLSSQRDALMQTPATKRGLKENLETLVNQLRPRVVAAYLPFGSEPDIKSFIQDLVLNGVKVLLPISQEDHTMTWVHWSGQASAPGIFGFHEGQGEPAKLDEADLILVPAMAATPSGHRLGKGKGFYDRALEKSAAKKAAVVFDSEVLDSLPHEPHDHPVDFVLTERRLIKVS